LYLLGFTATVNHSQSIMAMIISKQEHSRSHQEMRAKWRHHSLVPSLFLHKYSNRCRSVSVLCSMFHTCMFLWLLFSPSRASNSDAYSNVRNIGLKIHHPCAILLLVHTRTT
jgi:hypothetical protein